MATLFNTVKTQYDDFVDKLANKRFREVDISANILLKEVALLSMYGLSAMENSSTNMTTILGLLEEIGGATITPPSLVLSGIETEAAGGDDVPIISGSQTITFPVSLSSTNYSLIVRCSTSDGNFNSHKITNKTVSGFTIEVPEAGYIDYRAILV